MAKATPTAPAAPKAPAPVGAPAAVAAGNQPSAKPGSSEPKAKKEKIARVYHPALMPDAEGKPTVQLDSIPSDFDPKLHKPFRRKDLKDETLHFDIQIQKLEKKIESLRQQKEESKKLGGIKDRASAKKLLALQKRIDEVTKTLEGSGVDVAALLQQLKAKAAEKEAAKTEETEPAKA
jgi:hypothetical protein